MNHIQTGTRPGLRLVKNSAMVMGLVASLAMTACSSTGPGASASSGVDRLPSQDSGIVKVIGTYKDKLLTALGVKPPELPNKPETPDVPDSALPDRRVTLKLYASASLNTTDDGQPLGLVLRLYRLRSTESFQAAPASVFGDPAKEKEVLGDAMVSVREIILKPGQVYETQDKFSREAQFLAVVALFRKPAEGRWRHVFEARSAEFTGLAIGAHACALSVQIGQPVGGEASLARWAGTSCPRS